MFPGIYQIPVVYFPIKEENSNELQILYSLLRFLSKIWCYTVLSILLAQVQT